MRKLLLFLVLVLVVARPCIAKDYNTDDILSLMGLSGKAATQGQVTALLGSPAKIEESKKRTWWYYTSDKTNLAVCWNNREAGLEKFSFTCDGREKCTFDDRLSRKLRSGKTCIKEALTLLGAPQNMTVKEVTQEMHYAYSNSVLRLFFRNGILVDFTLLGKK